VRRQPPYAELGLDDPSISDDQLLDAMLAYPILTDCPIVVTRLERAVPSSKRPKLAVSSVALQKGRLIQPSPQDDPK
jgi:arsenate reductase-like glutaredoxin family protein